MTSIMTCSRRDETKVDGIRGAYDTCERSACNVLEAETEGNM